MIAGRFPKHPYEVAPIDCDFVRYLIRDDDAISAMEVTAKNVVTGAASDILEGGPMLGDSLLMKKNGDTLRINSRVVQSIRAGVKGERHLVDFKIRTVQGKRWRGGVYVVIVE